MYSKALVFLGIGWVSGGIARQYLEASEVSDEESASFFDPEIDVTSGTPGLLTKKSPEGDTKLFDEARDIEEIDAETMELRVGKRLFESVVDLSAITNDKTCPKGLPSSTSIDVMSFACMEKMVPEQASRLARDFAVCKAFFDRELSDFPDQGSFGHRVSGPEIAYKCVRFLSKLIGRTNLNHWSCPGIILCEVGKLFKQIDPDFECLKQTHSWNLVMGITTLREKLREIHILSKSLLDGRTPGLSDNLRDAIAADGNFMAGLKGSKIHGYLQRLFGKPHEDSDEPWWKWLGEQVKSLSEEDQCMLALPRKYDWGMLTDQWAICTKNPKVDFMNLYKNGLGRDYLRDDLRPATPESEYLGEDERELLTQITRRTDDASGMVHRCDDFGRIAEAWSFIPSCQHMLRCLKESGFLSSKGHRGVTCKELAPCTARGYSGRNAYSMINNSGKKSMGQKQTTPRMMAEVSNSGFRVTKETSWAQLEDLDNSEPAQRQHECAVRTFLQRRSFESRTNEQKKMAERFFCRFERHYRSIAGQSHLKPGLSFPALEMNDADKVKAHLVAYFALDRWYFHSKLDVPKAALSYSPITDVYFTRANHYPIDWGHVLEVNHQNPLQLENELLLPADVIREVDETTSNADDTAKEKAFFKVYHHGNKLFEEMGKNMGLSSIGKELETVYKQVTGPASYKKQKEWPERIAMSTNHLVAYLKYEDKDKKTQEEAMDADTTKEDLSFLPALRKCTYRTMKAIKEMEHKVDHEFQVVGASMNLVDNGIGSQRTQSEVDAGLPAFVAAAAVASVNSIASASGAMYTFSTISQKANSLRPEQLLVVQYRMTECAQDVIPARLDDEICYDTGCRFFFNVMRSCALHAIEVFRNMAHQGKIDCDAKAQKAVAGTSTTAASDADGTSKKPTVNGCHLKVDGNTFEGLINKCSINAAHFASTNVFDYEQAYNAWTTKLRQFGIQSEFRMSESIRTLVMGDRTADVSKGLGFALNALYGAISTEDACRQHGIRLVREYRKCYDINKQRKTDSSLQSGSENDMAYSRGFIQSCESIKAHVDEYARTCPRYYEDAAWVLMAVLCRRDGLPNTFCNNLDRCVTGAACAIGSDAPSGRATVSAAAPFEQAIRQCKTQRLRAQRFAKDMRLNVVKNVHVQDDGHEVSGTEVRVAEVESDFRFNTLFSKCVQGIVERRRNGPEMYNAVMGGKFQEAKTAHKQNLIKNSEVRLAKCRVEEHVEGYDGEVVYTYHVVSAIEDIKSQECEYSEEGFTWTDAVVELMQTGHQLRKRLKRKIKEQMFSQTLTPVIGIDVLSSGSRVTGVPGNFASPMVELVQTFEGGEYGVPQISLWASIVDKVCSTSLVGSRIGEYTCMLQQWYDLLLLLWPGKDATYQTGILAHFMVASMKAVRETSQVPKADIRIHEVLRALNCYTDTFMERFTSLLDKMKLKVSPTGRLEKSRQTDIDSLGYGLKDDEVELLLGYPLSYGRTIFDIAENANALSSAKLDSYQDVLRHVTYEYAYGILQKQVEVTSETKGDMAQAMISKLERNGDGTYQGEVYNAMGALVESLEGTDLINRQKGKTYWTTVKFLVDEAVDDPISRLKGLLTQLPSAILLAERVTSCQRHNNVCGVSLAHAAASHLITVTKCIEAERGFNALLPKEKAAKIPLGNFFLLGGDAQRWKKTLETVSNARAAPALRTVKKLVDYFKNVAFSVDQFLYSVNSLVDDEYKKAYGGEYNQVMIQAKLVHSILEYASHSDTQVRTT